MRAIQPPTVRFAEGLAAVSLASDAGHDQPLEKSLRNAVIAVRLGEELGVRGEELSAVYYVALLRSMGCTANAHRTAALLGGDDRAFAGLVQALAGGGAREWARRAARLVAESAPELAGQRSEEWFLTEGRVAGAAARDSACEVATALVRRLGLAVGVQAGLEQVYERWDGLGPGRIGGPELERSARCPTWSTSSRSPTGRAGWRRRSRSPPTGRAGTSTRRSSPPSSGRPRRFSGDWRMSTCSTRAEPSPQPRCPRAKLPELARAIADFADLKSPWTVGHSPAVAELAVRTGSDPGAAERLHLAGLLHDLGRLAVPNGIWDKPGGLGSAQWERVRLHPYYTERILTRTRVFADVAGVAGAHHERLDGLGYHRGLRADGLTEPMRVLAVADAYVAMTSDRPHRPGCSAAAASREVRRAVVAGRWCERAAGAVLEAAGHGRGPAPVPPGGLSERLSGWPPAGRSGSDDGRIGEEHRGRLLDPGLEVVVGGDAPEGDEHEPENALVADDHRAGGGGQGVGGGEAGAGQGFAERLHAGHRRAERVVAPGGEGVAEALARGLAVEPVEWSVVDLDQPVVDPGRDAGGGGDRLGRVPGAGERAREDGVDPRGGEKVAGAAGLVAPEGGQGDVGLPGVDVAGRALGLSVADDVGPLLVGRWVAGHRGVILTGGPGGAGAGGSARDRAAGPGLWRRWYRWAESKPSRRARGGAGARRHRAGSPGSAGAAAGGASRRAHAGRAPRARSPSAGEPDDREDPMAGQDESTPHRPAGGSARRRRRWTRLGAGRVGRLSASVLLGPLAVLAGAEPAGAPAAVDRPVRLRPIDRWDGAALGWMAPAVGRWTSPAPVAAARPKDPTTTLVRRIFLAGDRIARLPYKWGGGHGSFADTGYDCSGSVSYVLHAAGLLDSPEASGALTAYGVPGPGRRVTVYANAAHALVTVDGRRFDTINLQETGTRWSPRAGSLSGYVLRHPAGL